MLGAGAAGLELTACPDSESIAALDPVEAAPAQIAPGAVPGASLSDSALPGVSEPTDFWMHDQERAYSNGMYW
jgi:hypothetical protein